MRFAQKRVERNLDRFEALMGSRNVQEWMGHQAEFLRDNLDAFLQTTQRSSEIAAQSADQAVRQLASAPQARP